MKRKLTLLVIFTLCAAAVGAEPRDRFGGWTDARGQATGFFHAEQIEDVWWLITPDGNAFFSKGANRISKSVVLTPEEGARAACPRFSLGPRRNAGRASCRAPCLNQPWSESLGLNTRVSISR